MQRELTIDPPDDDGAVFYVVHCGDAEGATAHQSAAPIAGAFRNADGQTARKAWLAAAPGAAELA